MICNHPKRQRFLVKGRSHLGASAALPRASENAAKRSGFTKELEYPLLMKEYSSIYERVPYMV